MIYDYENKTIQVKIVYYGPAMSGKTASIKNLFSFFNKGDILTSIESTVGRTLFFDFGVLQFEGGEWSLKFLIYSATGQDFYASTRPATLNGVEGIIFVADSREQCLQHNLRSWNELKTMFREDFQTLPILVSFNKQDLQDKINPGEFLKTIDSSNFSQLAYEHTNAINGEGIFDSFKKLLEFIFPNLRLL